MILYINSCVREGSRTNRIAEALLKKLGGVYEELKLADMGLKPLSKEDVEVRMKLLEQGKLSAAEFSLARQFAAADSIVIAAPFWDMSFPALLKIYIENIYITGIVSKYDEHGMPEGLCRAEKLYYVASSGGPFMPEFGYNYIKALAEVCFGIKEVELVAAEMLDVDGFDAEKIVADVISGLK